MKVSLTQQGRAALLALAQGEAWVFEADSRVLAIEESVFFAAPDGPRRSSQIVIAADPAQIDALVWTLTRITPGSERRGRAREAPPQMF